MISTHKQKMQLIGNWRATWHFSKYQPLGENLQEDHRKNTDNDTTLRNKCLLSNISTKSLQPFGLNIQY